MTIRIDSDLGISASGNITGNVFIGNGSGLTAVSAANVTGNVANATYATSAGTAGTVTTGAQPNITSVGTLTSVSVTGNVTGGNVTTGIVSATGNITGGNVSGTNLTGSLTTAAQANITSVGTLTSLSVTGNVTSGGLITGNITGATTGVFLDGNIFVVGTIQTTAFINAIGNIRGINLRTDGQMTATGNVYGNNFISTSTIQLPVFAGNTARNTAISTPTAGMIVFNSTGNTFQGYNGTAWVTFTTS
jgi:hypothetical protein